MPNEKGVGVRGSRIVFWAIALIAALASGSSGYLSGTMNGDIPWPATEVETGVYNTARILSIVAAVAVVLAIAFWAISRSPRSNNGGRIWLASAVILVASLALFFTGYAIGATQTSVAFAN